MSETEIAELRTELRQVKADLAEVQATVRELRDLLLQAKGGFALARWILGGGLVAAIGAMAALYQWVKAH
jgi:hypothetical protein